MKAGESRVVALFERRAVALLKEGALALTQEPSLARRLVSRIGGVLLGSLAIAGSGACLLPVAAVARSHSGAGARAASSHGGTHGCRPVRLHTTGLTDGEKANVLLLGPKRVLGDSHQRLALDRTLDTGGTVCIPSGHAYVLVVDPSKVSAHVIAYPTTATEALPSQRIAFTVSAAHEAGSSPASAEAHRGIVAVSSAVTLSADYFDEAPGTTVLLPAGTIEVPHGRVLPAHGRFTARRTRQTAALRPGDIVVEPLGPGVPGGILARVKSVASAGRALSLATETVEPFLAFTRASLAIEAHAAPSKQSLSFPPAKSARARIASLEALGFGCEAQELSASGSVELSPHASLSLSWERGWFEVPIGVQGSFALYPEVGASIALKAPHGISCSATQALTTIPLGSYPTDFGVISVDVPVNASFSASSATALDESFSTALNGSIGASFHFGLHGAGFSPADSLTLTGALSGSQEPEGWQGSVFAGVGPSLQVRWEIPGLAGAGPEAGILLGPELSGRSSGWKLAGTLKGLVGIGVNVLGWSLSDEETYPLAETTLTEGRWNPAPTSPLDATVTGRTFDTLTVGWQPPSYGGSAGLSEYVIGWMTPTASCPSTPPEHHTSVPKSATSATIEEAPEGLRSQTAYTLCLYARSGSSYSAPATLEASTLPPSAPGAPTITSAAASYGPSGWSAQGESCTPPKGSSEQVADLPVANLTAVGPEHPEGPPITEYLISWSGAGTGGTCTVEASLLGINSFPLPAFLPATTEGSTKLYPYTVTVAAKNSVGYGRPSETAGFEDVVAPFEPTAVSATGGEMTIEGKVGPGIRVSWNPPGSDGGDPVTSYTVLVSGPGSCGGTIAAGEPASASSATIALPGPCAYGTAFDVRVHAASAAGSGPASSPITVTPVTTPGRAALSAERQRTRTPQLLATWRPPSSDGGSPVGSFLLVWLGDGRSGELSLPGSARSDTLSLPAFGLYRLSLFAVNAAGEGPASETTAEDSEIPPGCGKKCESPPPPHRAVRPGPHTSAGLRALLSASPSWLDPGGGLPPAAP